MVRYASLFSQLIALFNRSQFYQLVLTHNSERYAKGYNSWDHFIAMLFCQLPFLFFLPGIMNNIPISGVYPMMRIEFTLYINMVAKV